MIAVRLTDRDIAGAGLAMRVAEAVHAATADGVALLQSPGAAIAITHRPPAPPETHPASLLEEPWAPRAARIVRRLTGGPR